LFDQQRNRVRIDESRQQMLALEDELGAWLAKRRDDDEHHQYHTQLEALETAVRSALAELAPELVAIHPGRAPGEVYDGCRAFDLRVLWLRRVWDFFREKLDQRDDPRLRPVLKAADEVVWSCYRPAFLRAQVWTPGLDAGPAPLPFVESRYSPEAFPRELVPQDLKREVDLTFLQAHLAALPIPLVRLPPTCVESPWGLVYLAHELGHHVQYRLLPGRKLVDDSADRIGDAVRETAPEAEESWRSWSREIFADFYSVLLMGTWAARAMLELELRGRSAMSATRSTYPSPLIRVYLMMETARLLELTVEKELLDSLLALAEATPAQDAERALASRVAQALLRLQAHGQSVRYLSGYALDHFETDVPDWSRKLRKDGEPEAMETLEAARLATAGTVAAWNEVSAEPDEQERARLRERLRERSLDLIARCREPGKRDAPAETAPTGLGKGLAAALLARDPKTLETSGESV
jgi:hypothetical protein